MFTKCKTYPCSVTWDSKLIVATSVPLVLQGVGVELFIYKPDHEPQPKYRSIGDAH